jgi:hypothetical protein
MWEATMQRAFLPLIAVLLTHCGNGIPVSLRVDSFTTTLDIEASIEQVEAALKTSGVLPAGAAGIPEMWPPSLPHITYTQDITSQPQAINISGDQPQYAQIFQYKSAVQRVELNQLVLRLEQNSTNIDLPGATLQAAAGLTPNPDDPKVWITLGTLPPALQKAAAPGDTPTPPVEDLAFTFLPGGETFIDSQLSTDGTQPIQFALRTRGVFTLDTAKSPYRPHGKITLRIILMATFFVSPERL